MTTVFINVLIKEALKEQNTSINNTKFNAYLIV